jgi:hypothetical protein
MARRGKQLTKAEKAQRRKQREDEDLAKTIEDIAAHFTCMIEVARDFAGQCEASMGDLDFDLACTELALEFWAGRPGLPEHVLALLTELAAERRRHRDATAALAARLTAFADEADLTEAGHVHLEPIEAYRARVRQRLYPDL